MNSLDRDDIFEKTEISLGVNALSLLIQRGISIQKTKLLMASLLDRFVEPCCC